MCFFVLVFFSVLYCVFFFTHLFFHDFINNMYVCYMLINGIPLYIHTRNFYCVIYESLYALAVQQRIQYNM